MNNNSPKVTVLTSVYNGGKYLRETIESVLNQTYKDFEFLILNDCSTDHSRAIILSYGDPRIRLIDNEHNLGIVDSVNKGLKLARGEYISRLDADDIALPEKLEKQVYFLDQHPDIAFMASAFIVINSAGEFLREFRPPAESEQLKKELLRKNCLAQSSVMFRKTCIDAVGYYRKEFPQAEDYDMWFRITEKFKFASIEKPLLLWRFHADSITLRQKHWQDTCAELAKELHKERTMFGQDAIEIGRGKEVTEGLIRTFNEETPENNLRRVLSIHFTGFCLLVNHRNREALSTYFQALKYKKLVAKTWLLIILAAIKIIIPRKIFTLMLLVYSRLDLKINSLFKGS